MTRRSFLGTLALTSVAPRWSAQVRGRRVNIGSLIGRITNVKLYGAERPWAGANRVAYSDADVEARGYVMRLMTAAGVQPRIDAAGNIFGRRPGSDPSLAPILFGSHIDSVPNGGAFDGTLGALAALGVIEDCDFEGIGARHPLEMVIWAHSEHVAFNRGLAGSRIAAGDVAPSDFDEVWNGMRRADAIRKIGGDPDRITEASIRPGSVHCYLELHVEQGPVLERLDVPIGVVEGIVGVDRHHVSIAGVSRPAGSTPMDERRDALVAASHLTIAVRDAVVRAAAAVTGTVDRLDMEPNAPGMVPGTVRLTIDLRGMSDAPLRAIAADIAGRAAAIATGTGTSITIAEPSRRAPVATTGALREAIERAAASLRLKTAPLASGLPHDAQRIARLAPMGMIFVPSAGGVTHAPDEQTSPMLCSYGADVLLRTVLDVDRSLPDRLGGPAGAEA